VCKQLNRAQLRNRCNRNKTNIDDKEKQNTLYDWLNENIRDKDTAYLARVNTKEFLYHTSQIYLLPSERLRQLAIFIENEICSTREFSDWLIIDRIYQKALKISAKDMDLHHSRALTGYWHWELNNDEKERQRICRVVWKTLDAATAISKSDADIVYLKGHMCYFKKQSETQQALKYYNQALSIDPQHPFSLLYRAHCLHDLELWKEAAIAYSNVNISFCDGQVWRQEIFYEQKAYCYYKAGDKETAYTLFSKLLQRWQNNPYFVQQAYGMHLVEILKNNKNFLPQAYSFVEQQGWI